MSKFKIASIVKDEIKKQMSNHWTHKGKENIKVVSLQLKKQKCNTISQSKRYKTNPIEIVMLSILCSY